MAKYLWACWDGGGNLTPSLGVAGALADRGHDVEFFGRPQMVPRVTAAGLAAAELADSFRLIDQFSSHPLATVFGYTCSPAVGEELVGVVAERQPDVVVIDAMFTAALAVAPRYDRPTAVMVHTLFDRLYDGWQGLTTMQSELRQQAGHDGLPGLDVLWGQRDLIQVNTLAAFDVPRATDWTNVRHGAPVLAMESRALPFDLPWSVDDPTPIVLVSFSTVAEQKSVDKLQRALDALAPLPVHVVATTGGIVDPADLRAPDDAFVVEFADHDALLSRAALLVGHGGHGTTMRSLSTGVPMVIIPAVALDQGPNGTMVGEWGAGIALLDDPGVEEIRAAAQKVLADASFTDAAARAGAQLAGLDGSLLAADSLEELLGIG